MRYLPSLLTILGLALALAGAALLASGELARPLLLLSLGAACDVADGWLARRLGAASEWGARLDWHSDAAVGTAILVASGLAGLVPLLVLLQARAQGRVRISGRSAATAAALLWTWGAS